MSTALQSKNPSYVLPASTIHGQVVVSLAEAAALNLNTGISPFSSAGSVGFNSSSAWSFSSTSTAVSGQYSFVGVAEHEISEVMGRYAMLNPTCTGSCAQQQSVLDLYRYTSAGVLDTTGGNAYFSTNGGATPINNFNGNPTKGDLGDWAAVNPGDSFNYAASTNQALPFSAADLTEMKALGYTATSPVPEPETYAMLLAGLTLTGFMARRRKAA